MGWQGRVRRRKEVERVAAALKVHWLDIEVWCWRDDRRYHVTVWQRVGRQQRRIFVVVRRLDRRTLEDD